MKLRNLFLASIAAFAMASCSNDIEGIDNGGDSSNAEKNAVMQFRFAYGSNNASGVRAYTDGAGLDAEQKFQNVLLVGVYPSGESNAFVKTITRDQFTPIATTTDPANDGKYYQSTPFEVTAGAINTYVILNPTTAMIDALKAYNDKSATAKQVEATLKALQVAAVADATANDKFIMYGKTLGKTLVEKETTPVSVTVDRIVAKMKEETATVIYENITKGATEGTLSQSVTITLNGYAFTNLTDKSNLVYQNDNKVTTFISESVFDGVTDKAYTYSPMGNPANDKQIDYCFENENTTGDIAGTNITSIIYRATITATDINNTDETKSANVYIYNNKVYNHAQLQAAFKGLTLGDDATIEEYDALGIRKYTEGQCYYRKEITTTNVGTVIKRNNLYKLSVSTVNKIGFPTTIPATDPTMMLLNLEVNPWTVNDNAFDL